MSEEVEQSRRQEFRKYLEDTKLSDVLTKILTIFYDSTDRPTNEEETIAFLRDYFSKIDGIDINAVRAENKQLEERLTMLKSKLAELQKELNPDESQ